MSKENNSKILRRYTTLSHALKILETKQLTLTDPSRWTDMNDTYFIDLYAEKKGVKKVLALCFTSAKETAHHWDRFAKGPEGVRLEFDKSALIGIVGTQPEIAFDEVIYQRLKELENGTPSLNQLPFLKREPYRDEGEFRIIYESMTERESFKQIAIELSCIRRITLSPSLDPDTANSVKRVIKGIEGCRNLKVSKSTLNKNERWKKLADRCSAPDCEH